MSVVVIGGGIVGATTAYHLSRRNAPVVLVDRADAGRATDAGAGIVAPWLSSEQNPDWARIGHPSSAYYPTLLAALADDGEKEMGHARVGGLVVDPDPANLERAYQRLLRRREQVDEIGAVTLLPPGGAQELFPALRADLGAVHVTGASRVDGRLLCAALRRAGARRGVVERSGDAELMVTDGTVTGVRLDGEPISADRVVVAAGAWTGALCRPLGIELPVAPQRGQLVHVVLPGADTDDWPVIQAVGHGYLLAFPGSRVVFGATRETGSGFDLRVTAGGIAQVIGDALAVAPALADATVVETRVGLRPLSADGLPLLGTLRSTPGVVVATGLGPTGLTIGPYAGLLAASLALGEQPEFDLTGYEPDRG
jgi:D-amino-acid dehydrogenase